MHLFEAAAIDVQGYYGGWRKKSSTSQGSVLKKRAFRRAIPRTHDLNSGLAASKEFPLCLLKVKYLRHVCTPKFDLLFQLFDLDAFHHGRLLLASLF